MSTLSPVESAILILFRGGHIVGLTPHAHQAPHAVALPHAQPVALPVPHVAPIAALSASNPAGEEKRKPGRPLGSKNKVHTATVTAPPVKAAPVPAPIIEGDFSAFFPDAPKAAPAPLLAGTPAPAPTPRVKAAPAVKPAAVPAPRVKAAPAALPPTEGFDVDALLAGLPDPNAKAHGISIEGGALDAQFAEFFGK